MRQKETVAMDLAFIIKQKNRSAVYFIQNREKIYRFIGVFNGTKQKYMILYCT